MKIALKWLVSLIFIFAAALASGQAFAESAPVTVVVNGAVLICDVEGEITQGITFVPLRSIAEELGADVEWNSENQGITLKKNGRETSLAIGSLWASVTEDDKVSGVSLEAAPYIKDERTMVPLRFIAQGLNYRVAWCTDLRTAVITEKSSRLSGDIKTLTESFFSELVPSAIKSSGGEIARDISQDPQSVINHFSNLWSEKAAELLTERMSDEECAEFKSFFEDTQKMYEYLMEMSEKYSIPLSCPVKMCAVKNEDISAIILDGQGENIINISPLCVLKSVDGAVVAENL